MMEEDESRLLGIQGAKSGPYRLTLGIGAHDPRLDPFPVEQPLEILRGRRLRAGRIRCVDLQVSNENLFGLSLRRGLDDCFTSTASGDGKEAQDEWKRNEFMERREGRLMIES